MPELTYQLVDVFTDAPFGGNQLAVFTTPGDLPGATMQLIARELNLSETVFVLPPADARNHFRLRIFTPASELPFAGHPTIGTSYVLHTQGMIPAGAALRLEEGVGLIEVTLTAQANDQVLATMRQPTPQFGAVVADRAQVSAALSLTVDDLLADVPVQVVSSGMPYLFIPIQTLDAMRRIRLRLDLYEAIVAAADVRGFYPFTLEVEQAGSNAHSRLFAPQMGISEDPATGSAGGPLGAYLLRYGLVSAQAARHLINEQGSEMKRPSLIHIHIDGDVVRVGGYTRRIGSGTLVVPD